MFYDYEESKRIESYGFQFYSLVMAAMRQADTENLERLKDAFPSVWRELSERYRAPAGRLPSDRD